MKPESRWADLDGPTRYLDFGAPEGRVGVPVVVCVHGLGGSALNWTELAPLLAADVHVLALDLAGHGRTPSQGRPTTVHGHRDLVLRFLTEVVPEVTGAGTVVLAGNSMGGLVSVLVADERPDLVDGVVLVCPALPLNHRRPPHPVTVLQFAAFAVPGVGESLLHLRRWRSTPAEQVERTLRLVYADYDRVDPAVYDAAVALATERRGYRGVEIDFLASARSLMLTAAAPAYRQKLAALDERGIPVLFLQGALDRLVPVGAAREVAGAHPAWRLEVLDDVGHAPQLEAPARTAAAIRSWLPAVVVEGLPVTTGSP